MWSAKKCSRLAGEASGVLVPTKLSHWGLLDF